MEGERPQKPERLTDLKQMVVISVNVFMGECSWLLMAHQRCQAD